MKCSYTLYTYKCYGEKWDKKGKSQVLKDYVKLVCQASSHCKGNV